MIANDVQPLLPERVVSALYRAILRREPDSEGLRSHVYALAAEPAALEKMIESFLGSDEYAMIAAGHQPRSRSFLNDHSQFGELELVLKSLVNEGARHRLVVDVGARGRDRSNSYDLIRIFGWTGLLIEANPSLIPVIESEFAGLDVDIINIAISDFEGTADFHLGVNDDVSSLDPNAAKSWGAISSTISVEVSRLGPLLSLRSVPTDFELLSLDIEGEDVRVLNDLIDNSDYRPRWIVIEASHDFRTSSLYDQPFSERVRETYVIEGQTTANLILRLQCR